MPFLTSVVKNFTTQRECVESISWHFSPTVPCLQRLTTNGQTPGLALKLFWLAQLATLLQGAVHILSPPAPPVDEGLALLALLVIGEHWQEAPASHVSLRVHSRLQAPILLGRCHSRAGGLAVLLGIKEILGAPAAPIRELDALELLGVKGPLPTEAQTGPDPRLNWGQGADWVVLREPWKIQLFCFGCDHSSLAPNDPVHRADKLVVTAGHTLAHRGIEVPGGPAAAVDVGYAFHKTGVEREPREGRPALRAWLGGWLHTVLVFHVNHVADLVGRAEINAALEILEAIVISPTPGVKE